MTTLAKFGLQDSSFKQTAVDIVANTYAKAPNGGGSTNWINDYYDDNGWWALGWIASYDLTNDVKYLNTAKDIFEDMTGGWTTPCNGGIWWDKKKTIIGAISNELFLSVGAHLANRVGDSEKEHYRNWAIMEWDWFHGSGIINSDNVINDDIDQITCKNSGKTVWTYNQGVILGGLAELAKATGDNKYIDAAAGIFKGAMNVLTDNGILKEPRTVLDDGAAQFKGVFVRGLAALNERAAQQSYQDFLRRNAESAWNRDKNNEGTIGPDWSGAPQGQYSAISHASGIDLLVATAQVT